jgi:hypothetical protein
MMGQRALYGQSAESNEQLEKLLEETRNQFDLRNNRATPYIQKYPELKKFLFSEPKSNIYFGFGASPLSLMGSKVFTNASLFQLHYLSDHWDIEIFSASIGQVFSNNEFASSKHFTIRSIPKFVLLNIFETGKISIGPLIGYEFVEFSDIAVRKQEIEARIAPADGPQTTQTAETLTHAGFIYGGALSQTFNLKKGRKFKISQIYYIQSYDVLKTDLDNWKLVPTVATVDDPDNVQEIEASQVFLLEFSYLF